MTTDRVARPALRNTLLGTVLRLLNPVMRLILGSPLHWPLSRWWILLRWRGPQTGEPHTIPVSHVREGDALLVTTGDRWWRSLQRSAEVSARVSGRWRTVHPVVVEDPAESVSEHRRLFRRHAWFRILAGVPGGSHGGPDNDAVKRAVDAGRTLIRLEIR